MFNWLKKHHGRRKKSHKRKVIVTAAGAVLIIGTAIGSAINQLNQQNCIGSSEGANYNVSGNTTSGNQQQIAQACYKAFTQMGWTPEDACAAIGNFQYESGGLKIGATEVGGQGWGLAQWTPKEKGQQIADQNHWNFNSAQGQCQVVNYQLNHGDWIGTPSPQGDGDGKSFQDFKNCKDINEAAKMFADDYERPKKAALAASLSQRQQDAKQWLAAFDKGNDKTTTPGAAGMAAANTNGASPDSSGSCDVGGGGTTGAGGDILQTAKGWMGWFHYGEVHPSPTLGKDLKNPNKNGITDCSGFVWLVLNKCGYKVPPNMGWFTGSMAADAKGPHKWLKAIPANQAKAGDIVIVNDGGGAGGNGHTAILMQDWHGNSTQIINEGGCGGSGGVNTSSFQDAFMSLLAGGDITFAEPIK